MNEVVLSLGGNQGFRFQLLTKAEELINNRIGVIVKKSAIYETTPWGFVDDNDFLNRVVIVRTDKTAVELLSQIHIIENACGRKRKGGHWESRTMDIDILFFNDDIIKTEQLIIPHEQIENRLFVLIPLVEIMGFFIHPQFKLSMENLLKKCEDKSTVNKVSSEISL